MNPLLPTVIILSSIVGGCILTGIAFTFIKGDVVKEKNVVKHFQKLR